MFKTINVTKLKLCSLVRSSRIYYPTPSLYQFHDCFFLSINYKIIHLKRDLFIVMEYVKEFNAEVYYFKFDLSRIYHIQFRYEYLGVLQIRCNDKY